MTLTALRAAARERGIQGVSAMKKNELIAALSGSRNAAEKPAQKRRGRPPKRNAEPSPETTGEQPKAETPAPEATAAPEEQPERKQPRRKERQRPDRRERAKKHSEPEEKEEQPKSETPEAETNAIEPAEQVPEQKPEPTEQKDKPEQAELAPKQEGGFARRGTRSFPNNRNGRAFSRSGENSRHERGERREESGERAAEKSAISELLQADDCRKAAGVLEIMEGYGFLRVSNYFSGPNDVYVSIAQIRRFNLRQGDYVEGRTRPRREGDKYDALLYIDRVNDVDPEEIVSRPNYDELTPVFPNERYTLETPGKVNNLSVRLIDLISPIGKGQRAMIVSQPKAGKTTMLKQIANGISENYPDSHLIVLLIDERPEEVTDMRRCIRGEVIASTFDEMPEHHTRIAEMVQERAMRLVEQGRDVVILLDSLTRLTRAYNLVIPPTGRTLSGGMDPGAFFRPKRFFGAARNIENGGSLTVIATALFETGSRLDDIVYEEFKGTGNMEIHLDRRLSEKRIFPAIDIYKSGTRREDLLLSPKELEGVYMLRKVMAGGGGAGEVTESVIGMLSKTTNNEDFLVRLGDWIRIYEKQGYSSGQNRYGQ